MIVKIIPSPANRNFSAVNYNTGKVDRDKGELMKVANFGPLQGFGNMRPQDYINYLQLVTAHNKNIKKPQFHAVISAKNRTYDKSALTEIAEKWMKEMGYGSQPYLIVFHKDTGNNHVHIVSTRIDKDGQKISSAWENIRSQKSMQKVLGYDFAFGYKLSTRAQFLLLLETNGYPGRDPDEKRIAEHIANYTSDKIRINSIRGIFQQLKVRPDFVTMIKDQFELEIIFHSSEGKKPYGYSIIDHQEKQVLKGSEVMPLKELTNQAGFTISEPNELFTSEISQSPAYIQSIWIADDVDDQQIHGMRRHRQKKARTNTR